MICATLLLAPILTACDENDSAEEAGEAIDDAVEETGDAVEDATER